MCVNSATMPKYNIRNIDPFENMFTFVLNQPFHLISLSF